MLPTSLSQYAPCLYVIFACLRDTERSASWIVLSGPRPIVAPDFVTANIDPPPRSLSRRRVRPPADAADATDASGSAVAVGSSSVAGGSCSCSAADTSSAADGSSATTGALSTSSEAGSTAGDASTGAASAGGASLVAASRIGGSSTASGGGRFGSKGALILARSLWVQLTDAPPRCLTLRPGFNAEQPA